MLDNLGRVRREVGPIDMELSDALADHMNIRRGEVDEVVSFYSFLRVPMSAVRVCIGPVCDCLGAKDLLAREQETANGVPVLGVAYKDKPADALGFLKKHGTPYTKLGTDQPGRVAIDWGLYGVPETYLIDKAGIIRWRWAGPLTEDTLTQELLPLLKRYA